MVGTGAMLRGTMHLDTGQVFQLGLRNREKRIRQFWFPAERRREVASTRTLRQQEETLPATFMLPLCSEKWE